MRRKIVIPILFLSFLILFGNVSAYCVSQEFMAALKWKFANPALQEEVILELREMGPRGLNEFVEQHGHVMEDGTPEEKAEFTAALDQIAAQKDAWYSKLYWHTDLEKALEVAKTEDKPILSLRMLGKLTENLSCANSRMFRTFLYPNEELSKYLRNNYVLHWSSERDVPKVSIDFGDGRKLETTVTGNSIHYVLDHEGRPIQGIPGVYDPGTFLRKVVQAEQLFTTVKNLDDEARSKQLVKFHQKALDRIVMVAESVDMTVENPEVKQFKDVMMAERLTVSKAYVERPLLEQIHPDPAPRANPWDGIEQEEQEEKAKWMRAARAFGAGNAIGRQSRKLMGKLRENGTDVTGADLAMLLRYRQSLQLETAKNEVLVQAHIHRWFAEEKPETQTFEDLNTKVYADLFITPRSDEWLGMLPPGVYTGLDNGGIIRE